MATETKGTVLIKTAQELMSFSKGEEDLIEQVGVVRHATNHGSFLMCHFSLTRSRSK